jgi:hypothetical protein
MTLQKKISNELKFEGNPRKINDKQKELLKKHIEELGDLSGLVYCQNHKAYVGGNQRSDIFDGAKIEIVKEFKKPNKVKTVANGYIVYNGVRYAYREVKFSEEQFKQACIIANNSGGENDWEMLQGDEWKEIAESVGLDLSNELNNELENIIEDKPIKENINFIIKCKNSDELEQLQSKLNTSEQKINFKDFILKAAL